MSQINGVHQAAIEALDCAAIMRDAGIGPATPTGVLWRGPDDASFTFYTRDQWAPMAPLLINDDAQRAMAASLDAAAAAGRSHVFCWMIQSQSQWAGLPLVGRLFFAPANIWRYRLPPAARALPAADGVAELRRSARQRHPRQPSHAM